MQNKILQLLFSTKLMAVLFVVFAVAMGAGTFIESKYDTDTARIIIFNAWWFEAIMLLLTINFIGNIKKYKLWQRERWATLLLHLAFILIIIGAFITRYISYEGVMPIKEGETENRFYSEKPYLTVYVDGKYKGEDRRRSFERPLLLSPVTNNSFSISDDFDGKDFVVSYKDYLIAAESYIKEDANGSVYLKIVEAGEGGRHEHLLKEGEISNIHNVLFAVNLPTTGAINIGINNGKYTINSPFAGTYMRMADKLEGVVAKDKEQDLMLRSLYSIGDMRFVFPDMPLKGVVAYKSDQNFKNKDKDNALVLSLEIAGKQQDITLIGSKGKMGVPVSVKAEGLEFTFLYGSKVYTLPFEIKLNDFIAQKYPGTEKSYSAFESLVDVRSAEETFAYSIHMNHVLDYGGYRFFQSSFFPDESGTVLSVNHDYWGTLITYVGYFLLYFSLIMLLFTKRSRFSKLRVRLDEIKSLKAKTAVAMFVFFVSFMANAQNKDPHTKEAFEKQNSPEAVQRRIDSILQKRKVSEEHAAKFGRLVIQDAGGRMKPINTFSSELLRKVSHANKYKDMNPDQVLLSMMMNSNVWLSTPIIYIKSGNDSIRKIIGIREDAKFASFMDFFDNRGDYKLAPYLEDAYKASNKNQFQKDFTETDKKLVLMNEALTGSILKLFPIKNHPNSKWASPLELDTKEDSDNVEDVYTKNIMNYYLATLGNATESKDYKQADNLLQSIVGFQKKYGNKVRPSEDRITYEILYNKYDLLQKLPYIYLVAAILMLLLVIVSIFKETKTLTYLVNASHIAVAIAFVLHSITLAVRGFVSEHAPWSNAYESIVYVAWATMLFGLLINKKSKLTVASAAFVTAIILSVAYANWIDPEIGNLQPVLNSYWLMIHVGVIVASYGPFALGMILGAVALLLMAFTTEKNIARMELHIKELTYINEMSLTVGLVLLTIGNFLGGQWANESWGRYWGWDPKETWALISIMVYAFVIHARLVPAMRSIWLFNVLSMFAFISILFTYYGVNFHLVGLHSYASGEPNSLSWIWYSFLIVLFFGVISYRKRKAVGY